MITYLSSGDRYYTQKPIEPYARWSWEVFVVQKGAVRLWLPQRVEAARERTVWVFPPGYVHGWLGNGDEKAVVTIFLVEDLPEPISSWATEQNGLMLPLTVAASKRFQELYDIEAPQWPVQSLFRELRLRRLVLDLALTIGELAHNRVLSTRTNRPAIIVENAMRLFASHLHEGWNYDQICRALPISPAHLRRYFFKVLGAGPREIFEDIRFRRATELISNPEAKLEIVAEKCGYQSGAAFSRAFRRRYRISPNQWKNNGRLRKRAQKQYEDFRWFKEQRTNVSSK